jgi:hypothetical protein
VHTLAQSSQETLSSNSIRFWSEDNPVKASNGSEGDRFAWYNKRGKVTPVQVPPWERRKQFEAENLQVAISGTLLRILWGECGVSKHSHIVLQGDELIVICPQLLGHRSSSFTPIR